MCIVIIMLKGVADLLLSVISDYVCNILPISEDVCNIFPISEDVCNIFPMFRCLAVENCPYILWYSHLKGLLH